jgi:hypothetical protein
VKHDLLICQLSPSAMNPTRLTRMPTIWQYVAGVSLLFPMVRKKRLSKAKTSDRMVSTRLGSGGAWEREEEDAPLLIPDELDN